jgi:hypothetical protein
MLQSSLAEYHFDQTYAQTFCSSPSRVSFQNAVLPLDTNADANKVWSTYGSEAIILSFESVKVSERICHNQFYLVSSLNLSK